MKQSSGSGSKNAFGIGLQRGASNETRAPRTLEEIRAATDPAENARRLESRMALFGAGFLTGLVAGFAAFIPIIALRGWWCASAACGIGSVTLPAHPGEAPLWIPRPDKRQEQKV
jgi:hypothetical protein